MPGERTRRAAGSRPRLIVVPTLVPALLLMLGAGGRATGVHAAIEPDPDARLLETLVDLRLGTVLDRVLDEPDRDPMQRAIYRVRMARADVLSPTDDPAERRARIDTLFERSAELIAAFPDHPLVAGWRLDRAEDAWRWLWPMEAAGVQVMLGVPDEAAIARVDRAVAILIHEVPAARAALDAAIEQLEFSAGWPDDPAVVREHRRLVEEERDGRLPILGAVADAARVLRPAVGGDRGDVGGAAEPSEAAATAGADASARIDEILERFAPPATPGGADDGAAVRAMFQQLQGFVGLEQRRWDAAAAAFGESGDAAEVAGDDFGADVAAIGRDLATAMAMTMTTARTRGGSGARGPRAALERLGARAAGTLAFTSGATEFLQLLAADAAFRAGAATARAAREDAALAAEAWDAGVRGWRRLADRDRRWFAVVRDRFARSLRAGDPVETLPPAGRLGWSDALRVGGRTDDATVVLAGVASDREAPETVRSEAWRAIGLAAAAGGRVGFAARATLAAAIIEPDESRARGLIDAALRLAAATTTTTTTTTTDAGPTEEWAWPEPADPAAEIDPLVAAVAHAEARHPDLADLDRWRTIAAGRLITAGRTAAAERLLGRIPGGAAEAPTALATGIALARTRLREAVAPSAAGGSVGSASAVGAAAAMLLDRLREAESLVAAGHDPEGRLAARIGQGRGGVLAAEAHLATAQPRRALAGLGLLEPGPGGEAGVAARPASIQSPDPAVRTAAADLGVRAVLELLAAGEAEADGHAALADVVARLAIAAPRAARSLVADLDRRVAELEGAVSVDGAGDPDRVRTLEPLVAGLTAWLRAPATDAPSGADPEALRALRAVAFREIGRAELAAGRPERAEAWFDALGGVDAADPAVLLGAAEVRFRSAGDASADADADAPAEREATLAAAMAAYRRLAANRSVAGDRRWWLAQLRMLQILERTGRGAETIGPRIRRLQLTEPELGGPAFKPAFDALARRFPATP